MRRNESRMQDYEIKFLRNVKVYTTLHKIIKMSRRSIITDSLSGKENKYMEAAFGRINHERDLELLWR
jgi:hypothetical protein